MTVAGAALPRAGGADDGSRGPRIDERLIVRETGPALFNPPTAAFDLLRRYRYELTRTWDSDVPPWVFCMLNPSKAGAFTGDLTITRCCGFAQAGGAGGIVAVNLFAWRSTSPAALARQADPVGELNDAFILNACQPGRMVVAAWGVHGSLRGRAVEVTAMLEEAGVVLHCLGVTRAGHPRHPSRLAAAVRPVPYAPQRAAALA